MFPTNIDAGLRISVDLAHIIVAKHSRLPSLKSPKTCLEAMLKSISLTAMRAPPLLGLVPIHQRAA